MPRPPVRGPARECVTGSGKPKKAFEREEDAAQEARRHTNKHGTVLKEAYLCSTCGKFHIGNAERRMAFCLNDACRRMLHEYGKAYCDECERTR